MSTRIFAYGTLKRGQSAAGLLAAFPWEPAQVPGQLYRTAADYPALVLDPKGAAISGELYTLDSPAQLPVLDLYEGVPSGLFHRVLAPVRTLLGEVQAWIWVVSQEQARQRRYFPIPITDWRAVPDR
jgi:gamma-glutamylcyclotransferase (GGCT)/AIG2-like uncharacterized protein YtfP